MTTTALFKLLLLLLGAGELSYSLISYIKQHSLLLNSRKRFIPLSLSQTNNACITET